MENSNRGEYVRRLVNKYISFALLIALLLLLFPRNYELIKLEITRVDWRIHNVSHYRYRIDALCFCSGLWEIMPITVEVKDGEVISVIDAHGIPLDLAERRESLFSGDLTMEGLFGLIQKEDLKDDWIRVDYEWKYSSTA